MIPGRTIFEASVEASQSVLGKLGAASRDVGQGAFAFTVTRCFTLRGCRHMCVPKGKGCRPEHHRESCWGQLTPSCDGPSLWWEQGVYGWAGS